MTANMLDHGIWIVVCDGSKALLLENKGDADFPNLCTREVLQSELPAAHDLGSDRPGRLFSAKAGRRAAIEPTDLHKQAEARFLLDVAGKLDAQVRTGAIKALVLIAPPSAMGILRAHLSGPVRSSIVAEMEKDYVKQPVYAIERHLKNITRKRVS